MTLLALLFCLSHPAEAARVKDVAALYGVRTNPLVGYGLVVGLNRSGDSTQNAAAVRALANRLKGLGMTMLEEDIKARNVAVVMVTARLPAGVRPGSPLDVQVSSVGDARSIEGGVLLLTPLYAANGMAMAAAQGAIVVGGYSASAGGSSATKNHPTVGLVPSGATVEVELPNTLDVGQAVSFDWVLATPDFTNSTRLATAVNGKLAGDYATAIDGGTIRVSVPDGFLGRQAELIATVESVQVEIDQAARVVVNERTGTVVMGADITVRPVAVAHGGLTIQVDHDTSVSQPGALSNGRTAVVGNDSLKVDEKAGRIEMIEGVTVGEVVGALDRMGVSPRDLIVILQAMHAAGGLQAEIVAM
ncbi:MAG: flagellar basal body P-ring protein FlgI [Pseudomonadota bacterium]|nr:flagellar basal body P-ring protein FlgI [Pseudomonadota bacterium]